MTPQYDIIDKNMNDFLCPHLSIIEPAIEQPINLPMNASDETSDVCVGANLYLPAAFRVPKLLTNPYLISAGTCCDV